MIRPDLTLPWPPFLIMDFPGHDYLAFFGGVAPGTLRLCNQQVMPPLGVTSPFQGSFVLENPQTPWGNGDRFLRKTMAEKNGKESTPRITACGNHAEPRKTRPSCGFFGFPSLVLCNQHVMPPTPLHGSSRTKTRPRNGTEASWEILISVEGTYNARAPTRRGPHATWAPNRWGGWVWWCSGVGGFPRKSLYSRQGCVVLGREVLLGQPEKHTCSNLEEPVGKQVVFRCVL